MQAATASPECIGVGLGMDAHLQPSKDVDSWSERAEEAFVAAEHTAS